MSSKTVVTRGVTYNVSPEIRKRAEEELLGDILNTFKCVLKMLRTVAEKVERGEIAPGPASNLITSVAWHVDRAVSMLGKSESIEKTFSYEDVVTQLEVETRPKKKEARAVT
ncbi:MAG: hypothetical protein NZ902_06470 [Acidilobaceae archaeon]|nr:hypothetical protein [Acidilobaceae archaeon]